MQVAFIEVVWLLVVVSELVMQVKVFACRVVIVSFLKEENAKNDLVMNIEKLTEIPVKEKSEVHEKQQKEFKKIGSIKHVPGHTLFEINKQTLEIKVAEMKNALHLSGGKSHEVIIDHGCFYIEALNKKNALKKYLKLLSKYKK